ncbi:uncharacterized protein LOC118241759 [Electrophorus electricus]|uniref:uncharacterized protein LOC118241759 n=1 Tax=Electrophorus electricus TaxID=8005 RepID=UPI0015CF95E5|nr:uncharacterized protein LOC118241759 [Electrophorus electricus]
MCSYCRMFIPSYAELEGPLQAIIPTKTGNVMQLAWTPEVEKAFVELKQALQRLPALGLPDPNKPFTQMVDGKGGYMTSVLCQKHGTHQRLVAYFSAKLDMVARGLPACLRAIASAKKAILASRDIVAYFPLTVLVPHAVHRILQDQRVSHLSALRWVRYHTTLLDMPNITVKRCITLNPATLLPTEEDGDPHDCTAVLAEVCTPRVDLFEEAISNPDLCLYVDGSASRDDTGVNRAAYAVVTDHEILKTEVLPSFYSAQATELVALMEACKLAADKTVNVSTDSRYAWGVVHDFGAIWKHRQFLMSSSKYIKHHHLVNTLLEAILLPKTIVKCAAHKATEEQISNGNNFADRVAKATATKTTVQAVQETATTLQATLWEIQSGATAPEPFQHWQVDFVELTQAAGKKYMLVCMCMFSKRVEAQTVAKMFLREIIPRWGLPKRISSDNGTPFVHQGLIELTKYLGIDMKKHCSYQPASAGVVVRANGILKAGLAKMCQQTGHNWAQWLPLVLWQM